jgi:hypothetical protein
MIKTGTCPSYKYGGSLTSYISVVKKWEFMKSYFQGIQTDSCSTYLLAELSASWEAANCTTTQELPSILRNPKVHHRVHKSPPLVPILNQIDQVHTIPSHPIFLRSTLILSTHLRLSLPSSLITYMHSTSTPFVLYALPIPSSLTWSF